MSPNESASSGNASYGHARASPSSEPSATGSSALSQPTLKAGYRLLGWLGSSPGRWLGIVIAVVALAAAVQFGQRLESLESGSLRRLESADRKVADLETALQRGQDQLRDLQARQALIDGRIAEAQGLQSQIEKLYRGLIQESADAVLAETESALMLASQQLSLGSDPRAALAALQEIDARLVRQKDPTLGPIRRALQSDIERLKAYPAADVGSLALRIDNLISAIDQLPLSSSIAARVRGNGEASVNADDDPVDVLFSLGHLRSELQRLIRVRRIDTPEALLLAPEQAYFLRENLRLLLLNARLGLLARNDSLFRADTERAIDWIRKYYDADQRSVVSAINLLRQLGASKIALDPPLPGESLRAVRAVRAARESRS